MARKPSEQSKTRANLSDELKALRAELKKVRSISMRADAADETRAFELFFENNPDYCYMVSASGNILAANRSARAFLGLKKEEAQGLPALTTIYPPASQSRARKLFAQLKKTGKLRNKEINVISKRGEARTVLLSVDAVTNRKGQVVCSVSVQRDITERKLAEEGQLAANQQLRAANQQMQAGEQQLRSANQQLAATEQLLRATNQELKAQRDLARGYLWVTGVMIIGLDRNGTVTLVNEKGCTILGRKEKNIIGQNWFDNFVPERMRKEVKAVFGKLMRAEMAPVEYYENPVVNARGNERIIAWHNTVLRDRDGGITGTLSSGEDVTEPRRMQQALRESEMRYRNFVEDFQGIAYEGRMADWTPVFFHGKVKEITGYSEAELVAGTPSWNKLIHKDDWEAIGESDQQQKIRYEPGYAGERQYRIVRRNGEVRWLHELFHNVADESGTPVLIRGALYDITAARNSEESLRAANQRLEASEQQLKAANQQLRAMNQQLAAHERQLRESRQILQTVLDSIPVAVFWKDRNLLYLGANHSWLATAGMKTADEVVGRSDYDLPWSREEAERFRQDDRRVMESGQPSYNMVEAFTRADGTRAWARTNKVPLRDAAGNSAGVLGTYEDITEQKRIERLMEIQRDLAGSLGSAVSLEEGMRLCLDAALEASDTDAGGIYLIDPSSGAMDLLVHKGLGQFFIANASHYGGDSPNAKLVAAGKPVYAAHSNLGIPVSDERKAERLRAIGVLPVMHEGRAVACLNISSHRYNEIPLFSRAAVETIAGRIGSTVARLRAREALQESEERFRSVVESLPLGMHMYELRDDNRLVFTGANPAADRILGVDHRQFAGKTIEEAFPPLKDTEVPDRYRTVARGGKPWFTEQIDYADEKIRGAFEVHAFKTGPSKMAAAFMDITDRKLAEEALRREHDLVSRITETSPMGILVLDRDGQITFANLYAEEILGLVKDEIMHRAYNDPLWHITDYDGNPFPDDDLPFRRVMKTRSPVYDVRHAIQYPDGRRVLLSINAAPLLDAKGEVDGMVGLVSNVTTQVLAEQEIQKAQRLESLGILAGGIAHDFNNLLGGLFGYVDMVRVYCDIDDKARRYLEHAMEAYRWAKDLTQQLLTFSKGGAPMKKLASVGVVAREAAGLATSGSNVKARFEIARDLWHAEIDEGQICQVINNMVINARHAMPSGGTVTVSAANCTLGADSSLPLESGEYVKIGIEDHGTGIPPEHLPKIFDPFFTTKHQGSGLGLATSYSIVTRHNGYVDVDSQLGKGTVFTIYLPATPHGQVEGDDDGYVVHKHAGGRILLMDDEDLMLDMACDMLTGIGYRVVCARRGEEAVEKFTQARAAGTPFDIVILDLTIPAGMGGKETIDRLREIDPDVVALVSSGFADDPIVANFRDHGFKGVVTKPYRIREMAKALADAIGN